MLKDVRIAIVIRELCIAALIALAGVAAATLLIVLGSLINYGRL